MLIGITAFISGLMLKISFFFSLLFWIQLKWYFISHFVCQMIVCRRSHVSQWLNAYNAHLSFNNEIQWNLEISFNIQAIPNIFHYVLHWTAAIPLYFLICMTMNRNLPCDSVWLYSSLIHSWAKFLYLCLGMSATRLLLLLLSFVESETYEFWIPTIFETNLDCHH